jgi:hypothetical protein
MSENSDVLVTDDNVVTMSPISGSFTQIPLYDSIEEVNAFVGWLTREKGY